MTTLVKTVKQHSYKLEKDILKELKFIGNQYKNLKNYVYSRFSGIKSIALLRTHRKIRDEWVKTKFYEQWKLPARYWKLALAESISNIKANWTNTKKRIRTTARMNENLNDEEIHYINYILKSDDLYQSVLTKKEIYIPKKFKDKDLNFTYLNNLIRRYTRKYKNKISYSKNGNSFMIDSGLYSYEKEGVIRMSSTVKNSRLSIRLKDKNIYDKNLRVKIVEEIIEIHKPLEIKTKKNTNTNIIGIDKGYRCLLASSTNNYYGEGLNHLLSKETERLNQKNTNRNRFYALYKKYMKENKHIEALNILENNLGKVKYSRHKNRHSETVKSFINKNINDLIEKEKPKVIVMENLDFVSWNNKYPKSVKRKLSRWIKGYIRSRLEYKCNYNNIKYTYINPAYTSKICSVCNSFGKRSGDEFLCNRCGSINADYNASVNILNRLKDKEINLYTNYKKVKNILQNRLV